MIAPNILAQLAAQGYFICAPGETPPPHPEAIYDRACAHVQQHYPHLRKMGYGYGPGTMEIGVLIYWPRGQAPPSHPLTVTMEGQRIRVWVVEDVQPDW